MPTETLEFELKADTTPAKKDLKKFEDDIDGFRKRIEDKKAIKFSTNVARISNEIKRVKQLIKETDDEEVKIELDANVERLKQKLGQAKRELRNYARTGEKDVSVLGKLFKNVSGDIDKTRLELLKLGKSTAPLDKIEKEISEINQQFKAGKINAQEYGSKLNSLQANAKGLGKSFTSLRGVLKWVSGFLIAGLGIQQLISFTKESVKAFATFEKWLSRINTVANTTKQNIEALGVEIKNISVQFGIAKEELLETGFNISSAGVEFQNVAGILRLSALTAVGASTDTTTAFNGIIAVVKKFGENINQAWNIAEKFFIANKLGQTTIWDMATAMQHLTASVKPAGVSMDEVFAILSTLTGVTWDANSVITQLNGAILALWAPTQEASAKFKELGIEVGQGAIAEKGFVTVAKDVFDAVNGNLEVLRKLIPEQQALNLVIALADTQNRKYEESLKAVTEETGNLETAVKEMTDDTAFKLEVAGRKWDNFKIKTGNILVRIWAFLSDFVSIVVSTFKIFGNVLDSGVITILEFGSAIANVFIDIKNNFNLIAKLFDEFSIKKLLAWELEFPDFNFTETKKGFARFTDSINENAGEIVDEWDNITNTLSGNSKAQQDIIDETIEAVGKMSQEFWEAGKEQKDFGDNVLESAGKLKKQEDELNKTKKAVKELWEENKKTYWSINKEIDTSIGAMEKYVDEIDKVNDKITDLKDDATESIRDINDELESLNTTTSNKLAERSLEIDKERKKVLEGIVEATKENTKFSSIQRKLNRIDEKLASWVNEGKRLALEEKRAGILEQLEAKLLNSNKLTTEELKLKDQLVELDRENGIIKENTTEEVRKQAEEISKLSEAEKELRESTNKEAILNERKAIFEAIKNGEEVNLEEIKDLKNLKLAEELSEKQIALNNELETIKASLEDQRIEYEKLTEDRKTFEADWTTFFGTEINKQKSFAKDLQKELERVIALQKEAWLGGINLSDTTQSAWGNDQGNIDNSRTLDVNINATNDIDIDLAVEKISEIIQ